MLSKICGRGRKFFLGVVEGGVVGGIGSILAVENPKEANIIQRDYS